MDCTKFSLSIKYVFHFTNSSNTALKSPQICHALPAIYLLMAAEFSTPYIAGTVQNTCCVYIHVQNTCCVHSIKMTSLYHTHRWYLKFKYFFRRGLITGLPGTTGLTGTILQLHVLTTEALKKVS